VRKIVGILLLATLAGCASGYSQFYQQAPDATPEAIAARRAGPAPEMPTLERSSPGDQATIESAYARRGYIVIGAESFNSGGRESENEAVEQGSKVGADLVLVMNPQYTGTVTSSVPITTPTSQTSYTTATATAYGPGGTVNAYGNAATTTYGSKTTYIPISVRRQDYTAVYFVKQKFTFGAFTRDLNDDERREIQSNKGAVILVVADETPAYTADFMQGDILVALDGQAISGQKGFVALLDQNAGRTVEIDLVRSGVPQKRRATLNQR